MNLRKLTKNKYTNKLSGFTLVELIIVVSIIGILAGITISVINPRGLQNRTRDATRQAALSSIVTAMKSHYSAEGVYPTSAEINSSSSKFNTVYLSSWPAGIGEEGNPDSTFNYRHQSDGDEFILVVRNSEGNGCFKYASEWDEIRDCRNCTFTLECGSIDVDPGDEEACGELPEDGCWGQWVCNGADWVCQELNI